MEWKYDFCLSGRTCCYIYQQLPTLSWLELFTWGVRHYDMARRGAPGSSSSLCLYGECQACAPCWNSVLYLGLVSLWPLPPPVYWHRYALKVIKTNITHNSLCCVWWITTPVSVWHLWGGWVLLRPSQIEMQHKVIKQKWSYVMMTR